MTNGVIRKIVLGAALLAAAAASAAAAHYRVVNGPKDFYFGHISYVEPGPAGAAPVVLRTGGAGPEEAVLNLPVGPGDLVRTPAGRRVEIQFDTGTVVRLDAMTELGIRTILARSLSRPDELTVLDLERGRVYVMYKEYGGNEVFQVLTPNAAVKMRHNSVGLVAAAADGTTEIRVRYGRARVLFGPAEDRLDDRAVRKGERLTVLADHRSELGSAVDVTDFELWNREINARFEDLHGGLTGLPKPLRNLSPAISHFAEFHGSRYGEWLWDDLYGYVWRPRQDDRLYPWGWRPYHAGRWSYAAGQMFWVPQEPWGWIPYHLGVWQWDRKRGWFWLPGSFFAPAWVDWMIYEGHVGWRPWSLFDWMWLYDEGYWGTGLTTRDRLPLSPPGVTPDPSALRVDALTPPSAPLPLPVELEAVVARAAAALARGDGLLREAAAAVPGHFVFVAESDLPAAELREKTLPRDRIAGRAGSASGGAEAPERLPDPRREAARIFRGLGAPAAPRPMAAPGVKPAQAPDPVSPVRFRDWNPDLRVARELGVRIEYSSMRNEVRCPELRISSRDRDRDSGSRSRLTSRGVVDVPVQSRGVGHDGIDDPRVSKASKGADPSAAPADKGRPERTPASPEKKEAKGGEAEKIKI